MKIKLDENRPASAVAVLEAAGHDVDTAVGEGLVGADDAEVLAPAGDARRLLVTMDRGLGDIRFYPPGSHAGIVVVRPVSQSPRAVTRTLAALVSSVDLQSLASRIAVGAKVSCGSGDRDRLMKTRMPDAAVPRRASPEEHQPVRLVV